MDLLSAVVTLFLVMDPLGNVPLFLSILKTVSPERRRTVLLREIGSACMPWRCASDSVDRGEFLEV